MMNRVRQPTLVWTRKKTEEKICVPKIDLKPPALLMNFSFVPEAHFSDVVGGGEVRAAQGPNPPPLPPPGSLSNSLRS